MNVLYISVVKKVFKCIFEGKIKSIFTTYFQSFQELLVNSYILGSFWLMVIIYF